MFTPLPQKSVPNTVKPPDCTHMPPTIVAELLRTWLFCSEAMPPSLYQAPPYDPESFSSSAHDDSVSDPFEYTPPPLPPDVLPVIAQPDIWPLTLFRPPPSVVHVLPDTLPPVIVADAFEMPPPLPSVAWLSAIAHPLIVSVPP